MDHFLCLDDSLRIWSSLFSVWEQKWQKLLFYYSNKNKTVISLSRNEIGYFFFMSDNRLNTEYVLLYAFSVVLENAVFFTLGLPHRYVIIQSSKRDLLHDSRKDGDESIMAFHGAPGIYRGASRARDGLVSVACN